jgi:hypothetical protein
MGFIDSRQVPVRGLNIRRLAPRKLIGANDDLIAGFEWASASPPHSLVVGTRLQDGTGQEELLLQLLEPLFAQAGRCNDQDPPLSFGPFLRDDQTRFGRFPEADLIGEQRASGERGLECEQRGLDLMGIQVD